MTSTRTSAGDRSASRGRPDGSGGRHKAGAFDIRNFIGTLLGLYGLILTLMGVVGDQELGKTGGINANLWAGLGLLAVAASFLAWARLRPLVVPDHVDTEGRDEAPSH